jgi:hypothetical protein
VTCSISLNSTYLDLFFSCIFFFFDRIFRENHITGYDFPELVENNGEALLNELKIENKMKRGKILRLVQARILGIGTSPDKPANMQYEVENCNTVSLLWDESTASVFPVHSYRVQRKKIGSVGIPLTNHGNSCQRIQKSQMKHSKSSTSIITKDQSTTNEEDNDKLNGRFFVSDEGGALTSDIKSQHPLSPMDETCSRQKELTADTLQWKTIYIGADNDFVDTNLEPGDDYLYRVQAWNSHGKSSWYEKSAPPRTVNKYSWTKWAFDDVFALIFIVKELLALIFALIFLIVKVLVDRQVFDGDDIVWI